MLRLSRLQRLPGAFPVHRDTTQKPQLVTEVGAWLYTQEKTEAFHKWCRAFQVRAYGNIKMTSTMHFARCLRATRRLAPGQAIITCPLSSTFNFLVVAKEMGDAASSGSGFPLQLNWMNYDERLPYMKSACTFEFAQAGWMTRIASLEESPFTPYIQYLFEDTRGRDGISNGMTKEREEESGLLDHFLSEMSTDACEDPDVFLENFFRGLACLHLRSQPIEAVAIAAYIPGTNFFKAKAAEMYVPTLIPLVDAIPQLEDGLHNTVLEYFPFTGEAALRRQCEELQLPPSEEAREESVGEAEAPLPGGVAPLRRSEEQQRMNMRGLQGSGFYALRALRPIEEGDLLYLRRFPTIPSDMENQEMNARVLDANRMLSRQF